MALEYPEIDPWYYMAGDYDVGKDPTNEEKWDRGIRAARGYGSNLKSFFCAKNDYDSWSGLHSKISFETYNCQFCEGEVSIRQSTTWDSDEGYEDWYYNPISTYLYDCISNIDYNTHFRRNAGWARLADISAINKCNNQCNNNCYDSCNSGCFNAGCVSGCTSSCAGNSCLTGCATTVTSCSQCYGICYQSCYNGCTSCASCTSGTG